MIRIPSDRIHSQIMTFIRLQILSTVSFGAKMNFSFFSTDEENMILGLVKIKAHTTSKAIMESLLFVISETFVFINNQLKLYYFLCLKFIFHQMPVGNPTITGYRVKVKILYSDVFVPFDLPYWVGMFIGSYCRHVNWFVIAFQTNIKNHHCTIVQTNCKQCRIRWMEIKAHNTRFCLELILWPNWVLDGIATN